MWTMHRRGFFSVVAKYGDESKVLVRARCERDIRALEDLLPDAQPVCTPDADYHWRLECSIDQWASAVATMATEINYPNFKAAIADKAHHRAYLDVWHDLLPLTNSVAEPEDVVMIDLASDPHFTFEPGDSTETTITFLYNPNPDEEPEE